MTSIPTPKQIKQDFPIDSIWLWRLGPGSKDVEVRVIGYRRPRAEGRVQPVVCVQATGALPVESGLAPILRILDLDDRAHAPRCYALGWEKLGALRPPDAPYARVRAAAGAPALVLETRNYPPLGSWKVVWVASWLPQARCFRLVRADTYEIRSSTTNPTELTLLAADVASLQANPFESLGEGDVTRAQLGQDLDRYDISRPVAWRLCRQLGFAFNTAQP